jgi:hypothetical protein
MKAMQQSGNAVVKYIAELLERLCAELQKAP